VEEMEGEGLAVVEQGAAEMVEVEKVAAAKEVEMEVVAARAEQRAEGEGAAARVAATAGHKHWSRQARKYGSCCSTQCPVHTRWACSVYSHSTRHRNSRATGAGRKTRLRPLGT
jgi:hypothetical protein